ncbi:MAG TPA: peptidoglycan DD-metalloendopeptidase family protein [Chitinophaga sp.]
MKRSLGFCLLLGPLLAAAQDMPVKNYPKGYFRDPLDIPISLAGNFGELRPNHFHSGMDIKTNQQENLAVHAAADGYVSRVGVSHTGFGNVIYITHPNGYTTVHGHLNRFFPALEQYVKQQEYKNQSWACDLTLPAGMFPVKKGQFIAWSGNTGGSAGPHLHFEIRETESGKPVNPLLFGFDVPDTRAPEVQRIAIYNRYTSIYQQSPQLVPVKKVNGEYVPAQPVIITPHSLVSIGIQAIDRQSNSENANGIYEAILLQDNTPDIGFQLDHIGYEETRYINAHVDYKTKKGGGPFIQLLYALPGNKLDIYHPLKGSGIVALSDGAVHPLQVQVKDAYGNTSVVKFALQCKGDEHLEDSCAKMIRPNMRNVFENNQVAFALGEDEVYDSFCFDYREKPAAGANYYSNVFQLQSALVPVHDTFSVRIKPNRTVAQVLANKIIMVREGLGDNAASAKPENGWFRAVFRELGAFHLETDLTGPTIRPLGKVTPGMSLARAAKLSFAMHDDHGIKSYRGTLDGQWLLFSRKNDVITYTFDEHCPPGQHTLQLQVTDLADNVATYTLKFKR